MAKVLLGNIKGPQGPKGATGQTGPQGPRGLKPELTLDSSGNLYVEYVEG